MADETTNEEAGPGLLSRRELLKAAGGITFLALAPIGRGLYVAVGSNPGSSGRPPIFTALPYIQPGSNSRLMPGDEQMVLAWQTDTTEAAFRVEYGPTKRYGHPATVTMVRQAGAETSEVDGRLNYATRITGLALGTTYQYRVRMEAQVIAAGYFTTRKARGHAIRFVAFGDNSYGDISDRAIAYQAYQARPDFVMNTGDNVYESGLDNEYARHFFPVYNADVAGTRIGAPLLRSIPFYSVIANHDVHGKTADKAPVADFDKDGDSLGFFTNLHLPLNGLDHPQPVPVKGALERLDQFRQSAGDRFPRMANYSFDYGDGHFLCLDSNIYVDPTSQELQDWIEADLAASDAAWKLVVYHHPAFNVGLEHYTQQHMRVLAPLFERHGVALVFHGHEHNYQRTRPFRFAPGDISKAGTVNSSAREVPGTFTVDRNFDGVSQTRPDGVIYLTTGAGGKHLYDPDFSDQPSRWLRDEDGRVEYVAKLVSDRHSLTVIDLTGTRLLLRQVDQWGAEIDRIVLTRG